MSSKPTGTVTFLFTDIEGSTRLAREWPELWEATRSRHHQILREAIEAVNGYAFHIIGDAFCAAFPTAGEALRSAMRIQLELSRENWGEIPLKVRMGIHTGNAEIQEEGDYHGYLTMSHIQRLMSAAHGGQVLLSLSTRNLVQHHLPEGIILRDLGTRRLKDQPQPENIYQLDVPGLPTDFPPIRTLDVYHHNLPAQVTSFIGREKDIAEIRRALSEHRLVTLTGAGGTGKTRLSLQVATDLLGQFPDGVWFVELAPLTNPDLIPQSILSTLGIAEQQGQTALETLTNTIHERTVLIVLDNCEHLIEASARIAEALLNSASGLIILASSREALGVSGELAWSVPSLALPNLNRPLQTQQLLHYEAVRLFVERAKLVQPHFLLKDDNVFIIAQICVRLDGIPLALELAAARIKSMSLEQIASRLDDRFRLLTVGSRTALPRQQTLRATIDWSYNLLSESECAMLQRLSVFAGGWTLEAAEAICGGSDFGKGEVLNLLTNLVNKSLVIFNPDDERFGMLETVKQYAQEKMAVNRESDYFHAHMEYFMKMAEEAELYQAGEEQVKWLNRLEKEHDNFRVALDRSLQMVENDIALRISGALGQFWWVHNHLKEGREWLRRASRGAGEFNKPAQAKVLFWAGTLARQQGVYQEAKEFTKMSLELCRGMEDREGMARALNSLGAVEYFEGQLAIAQKDFNDALALRRELEDMSGTANALNNLAIVVHTQGKLAEASKLYEESLSICREIGEKWIMGHVLLNLGHIAYEQGNDSEAWKLYEEDLALCNDLGDREGKAFALSGLAQLLCNNMHAIRATQIQGAVVSLLKDVGTSLEPIEQSYFDKTTVALKHLLGEARYKKEFEAGKVLSLDQAIDLALKKESS